MNVWKRVMSGVLAVVMVAMLLPVMPVEAAQEPVQEPAAQAEQLSDWTYETYGDGIALAAYNGTATDIYVPARIDGKKVLKLGDNLFADNDAINSVTLAQGITEIGAKTFYDADNLVCIVTSEDLQTIGAQAFDSCDQFNSIILYDTVKTIGENAFAGCPKLTIWCNEGSAGFAYAVANKVAYKIMNPSATPEIIEQNGITYYIVDSCAIAVGCVSNAVDVVIPASVEGYPVTELRETFKNRGSLQSVQLPNTLQRIDDYTFYCCTNLTGLTIPDSVTYLGDYVFYDCHDLTTVDLSDNITSIGMRAFFRCGLVSIKIPDSVCSLGQYAFYGCSALAEISIPETITSIDGFVFSGCRALTHITIPGGIGRIAGFMFQNCSELKSVTIEEGITNIDSSAFAGCTSLQSITIPNSVVEMGIGVFEGCTNLASIDLGAGIKRISGGVFEGCTKLQTVEIPASVNALYADTIAPWQVAVVESGTYAHTFAQNNDWLYFVNDGDSKPEFHFADGISYYIVDDSAIAIRCDATEEEITIPASVNGYPVTETYGTFQNNQKIKKVNLPNSLTKIGYQTFGSCIKLVEVNFGEKVTTIGKKAFYNCSSLESITIPASVQVLGNSAFTYCNNLTSIVIPNGVIEIPSMIFSCCYKLQNVTLPDSVEDIRYGAFDRCSSLVEIDLPQGLKTIGQNAFNGCTKIKSIQIPDGVNEIKLDAFIGCSALQMVLIAENVTNISAGAFPSSTVLIVYENSYAHSYAISEEKLYLIYDGIHMPEIYTVDGVYYVIVDNCAVAFSCDKSITSVTVPAQVSGYPVTELRGTFNGCSNLVSVTLPNTLETIAGQTFYKCRSLQHITIPDSVTSMGGMVFDLCTSLTSVQLPKNIKEIPSSTFYYCSSLESVTIPDGVTRIGNNAFAHCESLKTVKIPDSVTSMGEDVFFYAGLISIELPASVTDIGDALFFCCRHLEKAVILGNIRTLPRSTFHDCSKLTEVYLPQGLYAIDDEAFDLCNSLKKIVIPRSVSRVSSTAFPNAVLWLVEEQSPAIQIARDLKHLYYVVHRAENPEAVYGTDISGTVTYVDGTAAIGAVVEILHQDGTTKEPVIVDAEGNYSFAYAEVGAYTIRATDADGNTATTQVAVKRMNVFDVFLTGDTDMVMKKGYTVSGTVNGVGTVVLKDEDGKILASQETTDGGFSFANVPNGTYILSAQTATGSASVEITVFNSDLSGITITVAATAATLWGYVEVEDRAGERYRRNWVQVTAYNAEGIVVAQGKSDQDGKYTFANVPMGQYAIVAEVTEMRPDKKHGFDRSYTLTGYGYVEVTEATEYQVDTIVLYEENDAVASVSGKVTANGETQDCEVVLRNVFRHEIAKYSTKKNGKYSFTNVCDGLYFITATTNSDGMGYAVVTVRGGQVYGTTDIMVAKTDKIKDREAKFLQEVPECSDRTEALQYRERIAEEKRFYDGLSNKEKKQLSKSYVERLNQYVEWITNCQYETAEGVSVEQGGLVVSGDELENEDEIIFNLSVEKSDAWTASTDGVHTGDDYLYHDVHDKAGHRNVTQYYEITMTKTVDGKEVPITDIQKDTDTTGKIRVTMPIPEEYRGHKHYSVLHIHEGEPIILTDLDENPDTITFEVDKFSVFILLETDVEATEEMPDDLVEGSLSATIAASAEGSHLTLQQDMTEDVVVDKTIYLDLNGFTIHGTVTAAEGAILYVKDSQTDDYTVEDGNGYGKITGTISGVAAQEGYMQITEEGVTSFHRLNLDTIGLTLRPSVTGVYYQSQFGGDEVIQRNIVAFGMAMGANKMPNFADKTYTRFDASEWLTGKSANGYARNLQNGTILQNILDPDGAYSINKMRAQIKIYSQAYVELADGTRILGNSVCYSLREIVEGTEGFVGVDARWDTLSETQKSEILTMYNSYSNVMRSWNVPNIKAAAAQ